MFQADFRGVAELLRRRPENLGQPRRGHGAGRADFTLAAHFGPGDGRILLAQDPDRRRSQEVVDDIGVGHRFAELHEVVQHRRNNPRRPVGRCRHHAPAGGILFVDGEGEQVDPLHRAEGRADHVRLVQLLQAAVQLGRAPTHIQTTGQDALVPEALFDTILHGAPELHQAAADLVLRTPDPLVGHHQFRHPQVVLLAQLEQLDRTGEVIRQHGLVHIRDTAGRLRRIDDKTAADRIVGVAMQLAGSIKSDQGHGVGMERQVLVDQLHVARPDKGNRQAIVEQQRVGFAQGGDAQADLRRVDGVRPLAHQAHDHRVVAAVADAGGRQRAIELHLDPPDLLQGAALTQSLNEQRRRPHGPHGMGAGRADADLEQVEYADCHDCDALWMQVPGVETPGGGAATL